MQACSQGPQAPLPEMQTHSNTSHCAWIYYILQRISVCEEWGMGEQSLADTMCVCVCVYIYIYIYVYIFSAGHGILYYKAGYE